MKENNSNCWLALLKNMICVVNGTNTLLTGKSTNQFLNLLGTEDVDAIGSQDFDNAYSKLQYASISLPIQIIVNGSSIVPPNCSNSTPNIYNYCCSVWSSEMSSMLQSHPQLKAAISSNCTP